MLYKLKGYSEDWIEKRMRGIAIREELTDEWKNRGAKEQQDYKILTAEISNLKNCSIEERVVCSKAWMLLELFLINTADIFL